MATNRKSPLQRRPRSGDLARRAMPKLKVWVAFASGAKLGHGRAELLELIDRLGSIQQAVQQMGMSYRYAWGYLRELEQATGFKLLQRPAGRGPGAGTRLTAEGRRFVQRYQRFEGEMAEEAGRRFQRIFSGERKGDPRPS